MQFTGTVCSVESSVQGGRGCNGVVFQEGGAVLAAVCREAAWSPGPGPQADGWWSTLHTLVIELLYLAVECAVM